MLSFVAGLSFDSRCERSSSTAEMVVFVGPGSFFVVFGLCCFGLLFDETQIWLGDLRVVVCCQAFGWLVPLFVNLCVYMATALCTALDSFASTSVRTEPRATSAIPEEKNNAYI